MKRLILALAALVLAAPAFAAGTLADVTIFDRGARRLLPVHWSGGQAFVAGAPGNEYAIRIRNASNDDLLAVVSVDGVNAVTGQTASPAQGGYVIPARGYLEIKGWRKSLERTAAFYFTDLGDSYAARTGRPDNVGVIGVALFKRKQEPPVSFEEKRWRQEAPSPSADSAASGAPAAKAQERAAAEPQAGHRARPQRDLVRALRAVRTRIGRTQRSRHDPLRQPRQPDRARRDSLAPAGAALRARSVPRGLRARPAGSLVRAQTPRLNRRGAKARRNAEELGL